MPPTTQHAAGADAVLAREQAVEATALWAAGDYDAAHQTLQRLDATLPSDARVQVNLLVSGHYADGGSSLDALAEQLQAWLAAHAASSSDRHSGRAAAAINLGLLLFLRQQHAQALAVLEPVFESAELLPDGAALCLCVLLGEIYLGSMQLRKAVAVLQYLQAATAPLSPPGQAADAASSLADNGGGAGADATSPPRAAQPPASPPQSALSPVPRPQQGGAAGEAAGGLDVPSMTRLHSPLMEQVRGLLLQQAGGDSDGGSGLQPPDAAALLHLYKARLALACSSHKAAKKELRALLAAQPDSAAAVLLKGQLDVARQQPRKALKTVAPLLAGPACQHSIRSRLQLLNLVAALHHQLGKHHVAALYLTAALTQHQQAQSEQQQHAAPAPAGAPGGAKQPTGAGGGGGGGSSNGAAPAGRRGCWLLPDGCAALSYNLGLEQLALRNWQAALECFDAASGALFTRPQLWLRLAEACLGLYHEQQQQQQQQGAAFESQQQEQQEQGAALLQQAAAHLGTGLALLQGEQEAAAKQLEAAAAATAAAIAAGEPPPVADGPPWLAAATAAAAAAAAAAAGAPNGVSQAQLGTPAAPGDAAASAAMAAAAAASVLSSWPAGEALGPSMAGVRQSLLANQAYVGLLLQQPQQALAAAQALLACSSMSRHLHHLGSSYAAEALCLLGRPQEAAQQLQAHAARFVDAGGGGSSSAGAHAAGGGGPPALADQAAAAGSVSLSMKSDDDGSCKSCSRGTGTQLGGGGDHGGGLPPGLHAAMLHNLSAALALQGDTQGSQQHAAMAAAAAGNPLHV